MAIRKVGVVGCGLMGSGIAQVSAQAGFPTVVRETSKDLLDKGMGSVFKFLEAGVAKGKVAPFDLDKVRENLKGTTQVEELADCDLVVEAVTENLGLKKDLFGQLDSLCKPETIFASNTSSLSVTEMSTFAKRTGRVIGLHFFNPVPLMKLVEVGRTPMTDDAVFADVSAFAAKLPKVVVAAQDTPGFVVNRLLVPYLLDAIRVLESGIATREDIDNGMVLGCGHPMGPLRLLDFVGLDTTLYIADIMFEEFKEPRFAAPPLLKRMVLAGLHGRKTGKGFYDWSTQPPS